MKIRHIFTWHSLKIGPKQSILKWLHWCIFHHLPMTTWSDIRFWQEYFHGIWLFHFYFIHPISQTFTTYWWSEVLFSKRNCSEKSNQILEITITYVKVKKRFQRKMWKIIIHFRYLCWCVFWSFIICQSS